MNWGEIKAAVAAYAHRSDLTAMLPTFLQLAEQRIYFGEANAPKVRVSAMRQFVTLADGARPTDFLDAIKLAEHDKPDSPLTYRTLDRMPCEFRAFSWDGQTLVLSRDQEFPVDLTYHAKFDTPAADGDTNWLMTNAPGVYLASLLVEVGRYTRDDAFGAREASNYTSAVIALVSQDAAASLSGSPLRMINRGTQ
jgi:hypothetical protein